MKKILLTTTALAAFAGAASADVAITGSAEMGIYGGSAVSTQFHQDIDVNFSMTGETDNGLSFGATVDLDENGAFTPNSHGGSSIFISGGFGTITMGDTDGAMDWALTEAANIGNPGTLGDDEDSHIGYNGSYLDGGYDGQIVRYNNTFGDFGVAVSVEMDDTGTRDNGFALGLRYNIDLGGTTVALGLGYQTVNLTATTDADALGFSANATFDNGLKAGIEYTKFDVAGVDMDHFGLGLGYTTGALSLHANYGVYDLAVGSNKGYALAVGYDLGGGASILAGYGKSKTAGGVSSDTFSAGLSFSF